MRALWVSTVRDGRGGVPSYVDTLARSRLWADWDVAHVATHEEGTAARRIARAARGLASLTWRLLRHRPDVVHVHTASGASFLRKSAACRLATAAGVPVVLHVHNGRFDAFARGAVAPVRRLVVTTLSRAATVVAVSEPMARELRALAPAANVVVVPNPVASGPPRPGRTADAPVTVVFAGRVGAAKGTFALVEAWARLRPATRTAARLVVLGDGEVDGARERVQRLGVGTTCEVRGWVAHADATAVIAASDVLVLASRSEGQPMAVLEAMAAGLCVVATPVGGTGELVQDDRTGLLVPPDDVDALARALERALTDAPLRDRLGAAARARVLRSHDPDTVADRLDALYRQVIDRRTTPQEAR